MNWYAARAIYLSELARYCDDFVAGFVSPLLATALYILVFGLLNTGAAPLDGVDYKEFLVPGVVLLNLIVDTVVNAAVGIFMPKQNGGIYEILAAPISAIEIVMGYGGAALTKAIFLALAMLGVAGLFVAYSVNHPVYMLMTLIGTALTCSVFGLILGIWATGFRKLVAVPSLVLTPLIFFSGGFYSLQSLPDSWKKITFVNPILYVVNVFRWSFYDSSIVDIRLSASVITVLLFFCVSILWWMFRTGYKLRS